MDVNIHHFTNSEVNNYFSIYHTSWITSGPRSNFICDNIPTEAILFFFGCSEVNSTWLIISELANQRARKVLFTCVIYTNFQYKHSHCYMKTIFLAIPLTFKRAPSHCIFHLNSLQSQLKFTKKDKVDMHEETQRIIEVRKSRKNPSPRWGLNPRPAVIWSVTKSRRVVGSNPFQDSNFSEFVFHLVFKTDIKVA